MRLLECQINPDDTVTITPLEYGEEERPEYAILSHRWREEEVEYRHMVTSTEYKMMAGYKKIEGCARAALRYGINFIWIDTCVFFESSHGLGDTLTNSDAALTRLAAQSFPRL